MEMAFKANQKQIYLPKTNQPQKQLQVEIENIKSND